MYEKFTDRARKVMLLANQEAQRFNHEYIGTEHVLLGLIKEGAGVAANVLKNLGLDLAKIRLEVEKLAQSGPDAIMTLGKLPLTPRVKNVIEYSMLAAQDLKHNYIGTEHILLGLLCDKQGVAAAVLTNLGLKIDEVHKEVLNLLGIGEESEALEQMPENKAGCSSVWTEARDKMLHVRGSKWVGCPEDKPICCNEHPSKWFAEQMRSIPDIPPVRIIDEQNSQIKLSKLKKLLIQQAEITTNMLELLKDL